MRRFFKGNYQSPAILGLCVICFSIVLLFVFPTDVPKLPDGFSTPIIAFEFAKTQEEVAGLFGPQNSREREDLVSAMNRGNALDYLYMILYTAFLFEIARAFRKTRDSLPPLAVMGLCVAVLVSDALENVVLFAITGKLATLDFESELRLLGFFTWAKWGGLALIFLLLIPLAFPFGKLGKTIASLSITCAVVAMAAFLHKGMANEIFSLNVALLFLLYFAFCLMQNRREAGNKP